MKICMPVENNEGLLSMPYGHFGSAPSFVVFDTNTSELHLIQNQDAHHEHGMCQPIKALNGEEIDAILVGGIGNGALNKLAGLGIKVYKAAQDTFENNIKLFEENQLPMFSSEHTCKAHSCGEHH